MNKLELGFKEAKKITKHYAKTFYLASKFLPCEKKLAAYAIYAICRISDNSVDDNVGGASSDKLSKVKENIDLAYGKKDLDNCLLLAFRETVNKYSLPKKHFYDLIEGMRMDLYKKRYQTFDELKEYCYKAAGVVGLIMVEVFGYRDLKAQDHAIDLGFAMQLTNILRDIKEDFERGRIYLPLEEINRFGVSEKDISSLRVSQNFKMLMEFQIKRIRQYFASANLGIKMVDSPSSRFVVKVMIDLYSGILNEIENNDYDVYSRRAHVNNFKKMFKLGKILFRGEYR